MCGGLGWRSVHTLHLLLLQSLWVGHMSFAHVDLRGFLLLSSRHSRSHTLSTSFLLVFDSFFVVEDLTNPQLQRTLSVAGMTLNSRSNASVSLCTIYAVLLMEPKASCILRKDCTNWELHLQPTSLFFNSTHSHVFLFSFLSSIFSFLAILNMHRFLFYLIYIMYNIAYITYNIIYRAYYIL